MLVVSSEMTDFKAFWCLQLNVPTTTYSSIWKLFFISFFLISLSSLAFIHKYAFWLNFVKEINANDVDVRSVYLYSENNNIQLHASKSSLVCFGAKQQIHTDLSLAIGAKHLEKQRKVKILDVIIDAKIRFTDHVSTIENEVIICLKFWTAINIS